MTRATTSRRWSRAHLAFVLAFTMGLIPAIGQGSARAGDAEDVVVRGGGWGHGIGMSQYGARGQARDGKTAAEIIAYYYTGATVEQLGDVLPADHFLLDDATPVWIGLEQAGTVFRFEALGGNVSVCHLGAGGCQWKAKPGQEWRFVAKGDGTCRWRRNGTSLGTPGPCKASVRDMTASGAHIRLLDQPSTRDEYARGRIQIRTPDGGQSFNVSLEIRFEHYLYGLAEVPASWETEALRAQAIAARSYAAYRAQVYGPEATMSQSRRTQCWCHLFATVADQAFIGWDNEAKVSGDRWVDAVDDTAGAIASHPASALNTVASTFYSSSTGGATQNNEDVWGGSPVPYLRSVPDPWSQRSDVGNPFATWEFRFSEGDLAARFGLDVIDGLDVVSRFDSGAPKTIHVHGRSDGKRVKLVRTGQEVRTALGLTGRHIYSIDHGSVDLVAGDFNGDGAGDVSALLGATEAWWTFRGDQSGTPRPWANHATASRPVTGDFDGDGLDDVAVRDDAVGAWFVGTGAASRFVVRKWQASVQDPATWRPGVVGDFDGDGRDDIAEYQPSTGRWAVMRSTGTGFDRSIFYDFSVSNPQWGDFVVGDYDGDGFDDIAHRDLVTQNLHVLFSDGSAFTPMLWGTLPRDADWDLRAGHFDANGRSDLAAFDPATGQWWVMRARSDRTGKEPAKWWDFAGNGWQGHVVADVTGDGRDDIVNLNSAGTLKVLVTKSGRFRLSKWGTTVGTTTALVAADLNGDGRSDIVAYRHATRTLYRHISTGSKFTSSTWGTLLD